ncbi:MAG TPA: flagellar biosynthetic protein FliO [Alphaproteobacteria bacterium]|nr:flagellar biosynthetic protein FliO [Alphaproteobacteria bacterium]
MELGTYMRFALALLFVLALIGIVAWLARKAGLGTRIARTKGTRRRLSIVEVSPVDGKRRLVLVRRDGVEHLVLLGATSETVIETGIAAPADTATNDDSAPSISFKSQVISKMDHKGTAGSTAAASPASKGARS